MSDGAALRAEDFASYPPLARAQALAHLETLQQLPVVFLGVLLRELMGYDWHFPAERASMDAQLRMLGAMSQPQLAQAMAPFRTIPLSQELAGFPWAAQPAVFVERLTAYLWTVHAIDSFHAAAVAYGERVEKARGTSSLETQRLAVVVVGQGASKSDRELFNKLRPHGTLFTNVDGRDGLAELLAMVEQRAAANPAPYAHWYVDGGTGQPTHACHRLCYAELDPLRRSVLKRIGEVRTQPSVGPEELRTYLGTLGRESLGADGQQDEVLSRFQVSLFTEGSGTQIFSTTFVQWAARELLRRAQPQTLLLRYAPRQMDRPLNDLLVSEPAPAALDPEGSLVDAEVGAYYTWINLSRISDKSKLTFLAWFEEGTTALAIAPTLPRGTTSQQPCTIKQLLGWLA